VIVEKEMSVGGLARSYRLKGYTFDLSGHLLHLHHEDTRRFIDRLLPGKFNLCRRNAWIHSHGVDTRYPFQGHLHGLPGPVIRECLDGLARARRTHGRGPIPTSTRLTFKQWCLRVFGPGISRHFMIPYNEKLWRTSADRMTPDWCGPFVPVPDLKDVQEGALRDRPASYGYNVTFRYPREGGIRILADALAAPLTGLRLGSVIREVRWKEKAAVLDTGERLSYSRLVSTLPLPDLLRRLRPFPEPLRDALECLRWASVLCANIGVRRPRVSDKSWIYFPERKFPFYRVGFPANFSPRVAPPGCSSLYVETSFRPGHIPRDRAARAALLRDIRQGLVAGGILTRRDHWDVAHLVDMPCAYVIYDEHRPGALRRILPWLERQDILSTGRYGGWKYSFMEEALRDGRAAARWAETRP
jgi:protoporphyrinogen oxidase